MNLMRESKGADEIATLINDSVRVVPRLEKIKVEVARLPQPDADGCNWTAHHPAYPLESSLNRSVCSKISFGARRILQALGRSLARLRLRFQLIGEIHLHWHIEFPDLINSASFLPEAVALLRSSQPAPDQPC